jgi:hypothetical protein
MADARDGLVATLEQLDFAAVSLDDGYGAHLHASLPREIGSS